MKGEEDILKYLDGAMTASEEREFQNSLRNDHILNEEFKNYKNIIKGIQINARVDQKKRIKTTLEKSESKNVKSITMNNTKDNKMKFIPIAASLALLAIAAYFVLPTSGMDPEKLFADHYNSSVDLTSEYIDKVGTSGFASTNEDSIVLLNDGTELSKVEFLRKEQIRKDSLTLGLSAFKKADWNKSKSIFFDYINKYSFPAEDNQIALFYYAKTLLNNGDYVKAIEKYGQFLDGQKIDKEIMDVAEFDLALAYLHNNPSKAKEKFNIISQDMGHTYRDTARGLYDNL